MTLQIICLLGMTIGMVLTFVRHGSHFVQGSDLRTDCAITLLLLVDLILYVTQAHEPGWHILRALRPFYLLKTNQAASVRRVLRGIMQTCQRVVDIIVLLFFYVGVFAVIGVYLYSEDPYNWFFADLGTAYTQLFVLLTTCNFPDIMLPAYARSRWNFLFFFVFIIGGIYFITNLVLAIIYQNFTVRERRKFQKLLLRRRAALRYAFAALTGGQRDQKLTRAVFIQLMQLHRPGLGADRVMLVFKALDTGGKGYLSQQDFYEFYDALELSWSLPQRSDQVYRRRLFCFRQTAYTDRLVAFLRKVVESPWFGHGMNLVVIAQTGFIFYSAAEFTSDPDSKLGFEAGMIGFLCIYIAEVMLKVAALGWLYYWKRRWNRFDFLLTALSLLGVLLERLLSFRRAQGVLVFRAFRLLRVLATREAFQHVTNTAWSVFPRMGRFAVALLCVYYSTSIIGMACFANTVSSYCPNNATLNPCGSSYSDPPPNALNSGFGHYQARVFCFCFFRRCYAFRLFTCSCAVLPLTARQFRRPGVVFRHTVYADGG